MANYLLVYHGGSMPETPEEQATVMKAWTDWFGELGSNVVDQGNPTSVSRLVSNDSVSDTGTHKATGYSIIKADDIDQAVRYAQGCPVLLGGASVEVAEVFEVM